MVWQLGWTNQTFLEETRSGKSPPSIRSSCERYEYNSVWDQAKGPPGLGVEGSGLSREGDSSVVELSPAARVALHVLDFCRLSCIFVLGKPEQLGKYLQVWLLKQEQPHEEHTTIAQDGLTALLLLEEENRFHDNCFPAPQLCFLQHFTTQLHYKKKTKTNNEERACYFHTFFFLSRIDTRTLRQNECYWRPKISALNINIL